ncbi:MAG: polysaccharide deacetylase family protein [Desulfovibrio sp.]|jgi:peptidoglycan/xylan/chitin deacetylase (PgdA/CDA1 family)|nr:polysaccharide deacetylase family protein [Desulfovibrio sp.]
MKNAKAKSLPVAMYHYINELPGGITVSPERFEEHCRALAAKGWRGVGLDEAEGFLIHGRPLPLGAFLFTFDDGYLDNYLHAMPLLRLHGHRGVVFAVSNRLMPEGPPRVSLEAVIGRQGPRLPEVEVPVTVSAQGFSLRNDVFLNHAEVRLMDGEGTLRLASHAKGHYGVFTGPEFTEFFKPRTRYRTFYRTELDPVFGLPDFPVKAGLAHRAFMPDPALIEAITRLVPQDFDRAAAFFAEPENERELAALVAGFAARMGRYESDAERGARMRREIVGGKEELEGILGRPVLSLCWPWGHYCPEALAIAREAGFRLFFTTREGANPPAAPDAVRRFKAKDKAGGWLTSRAFLYSRPLLGNLYAKLRV